MSSAIDFSHATREAELLLTEILCLDRCRICRREFYRFSDMWCLPAIAENNKMDWKVPIDRPWEWAGIPLHRQCVEWPTFYQKLQTEAITTAFAEFSHANFTLTIPQRLTLSCVIDWEPAFSHGILVIPELIVVWNSGKGRPLQSLSLRMRSRSLLCLLKCLMQIERGYNHYFVLPKTHMSQKMEVTVINVSLNTTERIVSVKSKAVHFIFPLPAELLETIQSDDRIKFILNSNHFRGVDLTATVFKALQ